jgi:hypothetical protein
MRLPPVSVPLILICVSVAGSALAYEGDCFFGIAWEGVRYDQLDLYTAPHLLSEIKRDGVWLANMYNAWHTWTSPSHPNYFTGNANLYPNTGTTWKLPHYYPSVMESFLKEHGLSGEDSIWVWIFGNSTSGCEWGRSRHPDYNDTYIVPNRYLSSRPDYELWDTEILPVLETYHPAMIWVDFHEVDYRGHRIKTPADSLEYREAIRRVDSLTAIIFEYIDTSSVYSGRTNVLLTTSHGRHSEGIGTGIRDHGCDCDGCRHVFGCLWGPDFKENLVDDAPCYQTDIGYAMAHVMGLSAPHTRTRTLVEDWLIQPEVQNPSPFSLQGEVRISESGLPCSSPDVARSPGGKVHTVWCENQREIVYRCKDDGWRDPVVLASTLEDELFREPRISHYGSVVACSWQRYWTNNHGFHSWYLEMVASVDGGMNWTPIIAEGFEDEAIITGDLVLGRDEESIYCLVAGVFTAHEGNRDSIGSLKILKFYGPDDWRVSAGYDNIVYQANYINMERFGSLCVAVCQAYDRVDQNSEIIATWSANDGDDWRSHWAPVIRDDGGSPYMHQRFPSGLVIFN